MDMLFSKDMQKDTVVTVINSVMLNPSSENVPKSLGVSSVFVNGEDLTLGGYLDIGIIDTMKDLIVNFVGAVVFSVIGFLYVKNRKKNCFAEKFIPTVTENSTDEVEDDTETNVKL
jgi:hypothetical protein